MAYRRLTDKEWEVIEIVFPEQTRGQPRKHSDRACLDALRYVLETGIQWSNLPSEFPPKSTVHDRLLCWKRQGVFPKILRRLRSRLPEKAEIFHMDATIKMAKKGRYRFTGWKNKGDQNQHRNRREQLGGEFIRSSGRSLRRKSV